MRILKWVIGIAVVAAALAFGWALLAPRRRIPDHPVPSYVAPEPADDHGVSVPDARPLDTAG